MISTQRFVDKIFIDSEIKTAIEFERLKILFMVKFCKTVKEIKWRYHNLDLAGTMIILSFVPLLSHLEIDDNDWDSDEPEFEIDKFDIDSLKHYPHYLKLESLKISGLANQLFNENEEDENEECLVDYICSRRLISVDISKLEIMSSPIMMFLRKQPHIQKIRLDLINYGEDNLSSYIPKEFVQLESLDLGRMVWNDTDFNFIYDNLTNLKSLVINIERIGPQILSRFAELLSLQNLTIKCEGEEVDLSHARSDSVTSLTIQAKVETPAILNVANNFLNLRKLVLEVPKTVVISSVLHRFVNLEELNLKSNTALKSVIDNCDAKVFPNMKRLSLNIRQDFCCDVLDEPEHLLTLHNIMPNLKYLEAVMALELRSKADNKKIIDVLKKVKDKVNSFSFTLQCYLWDEVGLVSDLKDIFEKVHVKSGPGGCQIIKIN